MGGFERKIMQKQAARGHASKAGLCICIRRPGPRLRPRIGCLGKVSQRVRPVVRRRVLQDGELQGIEDSDDGASGSSSSSSVSLSSFPFKLDAFQTEAGRAIEKGDSVLVTAPTGAGKTVIGEMAIRMALEVGKRAIYTTPIKALSNQKFLELQALLGRDKVGLITGDVKYQSQASVLVMTTEILRNILYKELGRQSQLQSLEGNIDFSQVEAVVLDEVHYLGDEERGSVWEECIIYLPKHVQMICLSATLPNAEEVVGWLRQVHGPTELVSCNKRPVPLTLYWTLFDTEKRRTNLEPVFRVDSHGDSAIMSKYMQSLSHLKEPSPDFRGMLMALLKQKKLPAIWFIFKRRSCDIAAIKANKILRSSNMLKAHERASLFQMIQELKAQNPESVKEELVQPFLSGIASHHAGLLPAWKGLVEQGFQAGLIKLVFATHTLAMGINMPAKTTVISDLEMKRGPGLRGLLTHNDIMQLSGRAGRRGYDKYGNCILMNSPNVSLNRVIRSLQKGSNPITSSFKADYGMVLNLIDSMGADAGKDLMKSSFLNYQCQLKGMVMEYETEKNAGIPPTPKIRKVQESISAQERVLSVLLEQTLALRKECIESLFCEEEDRLPCLVALDCNGNCIGQGDGSNLQLSVLFDTITEDDSKTYFLCLDQDSRLHKISGEHMGAIGGKIEEGSPLHELVAKASSIEMDKVMWEEEKGEGLLSAASGGEIWHEMGALQSSLKDQLASVGVDFETEMRISEQRGVVSDLGNQLERLKREYESSQYENSHNGGTADEYYEQIKQWLGKRKQKFGDRFDFREEKKEESNVWRVQLEDKTTGIVIDCEDAFRANAKREAHKRMLDLLKSAELYERVVSEFDSRVQVLCEYEALDRETMSLLPLGHVAAQIHSENQLWMAIAATSEHIYMLDPKQLAGFVCALVTKESLRLPNSKECSLPASERVYSSLESLEPEWEKLTELQIMNGISQTPFIDARLAGLAEQWASGAPWHIVKESVPIDEGDIVKVLHRTQDMLRQFASLSYVPGELAKTARIASDLFERSPLTDV